MYKSFIKAFGKRSIVWVIYLVVFGALSVGLFVTAKDTADVASAVTNTIGLILFAALGLFANFIDMRGEELNKEIKDMYNEAYHKAVDYLKDAERMRGEAEANLNKAKATLAQAEAAAEKLKTKEKKSGGNKVRRAKSSGKKPS